LVEKLEKLKTFMTGPFLSRQIEFALLDMTLYSKKPPKSVKELDRKTLEIINRYGIYKRKNDYKMYCSFSHIFG
jgi:Zn-dependent oligopeptidase